jgi:type III secretory pathway component EscV
MDKLEPLLALDALQIELGYGLVSLADKRKGGDLLDRVTGVRRTFAQEMGVIVPPIRLRDNLQMGPNEYRFLLKGNAVAQGQLDARLLARHERHQQQGHSQGGPHGGTGVWPARDLDHRHRTQDRRSQRLHPRGRRVRAGHAPERDGQAALPHAPEPAGRAGVVG